MAWRCAARVAALAAGLSMALATAASGAPAPVRTASGPVQGTPRGAMTSYFAIPFAAPPVGDLRWRAPRPAPPWTAPLANAASGPPCLQTGRSPFRSGDEREDCLYLDVHAPVGAGPFPVMVWIYGGAFTTGATRIYADPSPLVSKGVIVVTVAYRLGALGFLAHPALRDAAGGSGDYGIMDQQAALRWVRDNIAAFGGDAHNVTIFGESAGGFSVLTHLASPLSKGLFDKAIIESGAYGVRGQMTGSEAEARGVVAVDKALAAAGPGAASTCPKGKPDATCLRHIPESVVRAHLMSAFAEAVPNVMPTIDGEVLPSSIGEIFASGRNNKVPVINGSNHDENRLFIAIGELVARSTAKPPNFDPADHQFLMTADTYRNDAERTADESGVSAADLTGKYYPLSAFGSDPALQPSLAAAAAGTDATFSCNGANVSGRVAAQGAPVWMYEFRDRTAPAILGTFGGKYVLSLPMGAAHASELPYLFNFADLGNDNHRALQRTMSIYWVNFARTGNPNGSGVPAWAPYKAGSVQALDIPATGGVRGVPLAAFLSDHQCRTAWAKLKF
jgi:para-nitrobenzyl esterase